MTATAERGYTYQSTTTLLDDEGKALLSELEDLYDAMTFDDKGKKVRSGSDTERYAIAALHTALIKTGARFKRHEDFISWLNDNEAYHIEAYDPLRRTRDQAAAIGNLQRDVEDVKSELKHLNEMYKLLLQEYFKVTKTK